MSRFYIESSPMPARGPARDLTILIAVLFAGYAMHFFPATEALCRRLELAEAVWLDGQVYRLLSYPFLGSVVPPLLYVLESAAIFALGMSVAPRLQRARFWWTLLWVAVVAGTLAILASLALRRLGFGEWQSLAILQGQHVVVAALFGAWIGQGRGRALRLGGFSLRSATVVMAALAAVALLSLGHRDLAGGVGLVAAIALFHGALAPGGLRATLRHPVQHLRALFWRRRFEKMAREHGLHVVRDHDDTIN